VLSRDLELSLNMAFQDARNRGHEFMTVEHLLLALLDNQAAIDVLRGVGGDLFSLRDQLSEYIGVTTPVVSEDQVDHQVQPTLGFQRVLQRAIFHVQSSGREECTGANVLVAIYSESDSQAAYFLKAQDINRIDIVNFISHGGAVTGEDSLSESSKIEEESSDAPAKRPLDEFALNLNEQAKADQIDPLIGRLEEVERVSQILARRRKNNPLLVGESGVGKTAIAEGLARLIVDDKVPELLKASSVYSLDLGALLAGTKYRGDFEKRFKGVLSDLIEEPGAILFIDEIHTIIGAGAASGGVMDASNLLKPVLTSGKVRIIGSTTYQEYRGIFDKDRALSRRFQKVDVPEPSVEDTIAILKGLRSRYEDHYNLKYADSALESAAKLSSRHITDRFLPDKAIDVVDEAGAYQSLQPAEERKEVIEAIDVERVVSKIARIPEKSVSSSDKEQLRNLGDKLKMVVFGQDAAIDSLATAIKLSRAGLKGNDKPIGSFLFSGPTGVGKTEVTKQLANVLGIELQRFDMSEYMERHTVSRLIGAPPGYVGFDQGGLLTDAVTKHPHCVVLLDEVEKAHPEVFNLLLQVMDHGTLTDNNGRKADFRSVILVMTTNAGAELMARASIGFIQQDHQTDGMEAIKKSFTPEFRNRLDAIVQFAPLQLEVIKTVVDKFLVELQAQLDEKQVQIEIDEEARAWLAEQGYDDKMGARPMARLISEKIKKPLAEQLLFGELADGGGIVNVSLEQDELKISYESHQSKKELVEVQ
jgi:ATP-dependent Clp protease ATP-binding subunit ClpA